MRAHNASRPLQAIRQRRRDADAEPVAGEVDQDELGAKVALDVLVATRMAALLHFGVAPEAKEMIGLCGLCRLICAA
jgi:hypothetical protein